jgi:hypothetical protein
VLYWVLAFVIGVPGLIAALGAVIGFVLLPFQHESVGAGFILLGGGAGACWLAWLFQRVARRPGPALTLRVCPEALTMLRRATPSEVVHRDEVGLVFLNAAGAQSDISLYSPDQRLIGHWDTNWMKGSSRSIRALRRSRWPWLLKTTSPMSGLSSRIHSNNAPSWHDQVDR